MATIVENNPIETSKISIFDIWCLGITVVIGGQYFGWNAGASAGFGSLLIATLLIGFMYLNVSFCLSEITSSFPVTGGGYSLARTTLGFYAGYLIGISEALEYTTYVCKYSLSIIHILYLTI